MYTCQYCNKTFTSKEYFSIHELTHTQGKIYSCDDCKKSFVKVCNLDICLNFFQKPSKDDELFLLTLLVILL
jgi:uncharacterized Zn-finger protein